jgi:hypothetical protein
LAHKSAALTRQFGLDTGAYRKGVEDVQDNGIGVGRQLFFLGHGFEGGCRLFATASRQEGEQDEQDEQRKQTCYWACHAKKTTSFDVWGKLTDINGR